MKKIILWTIILLVAAIIGFFVLNSYIYNEKQADELSALSVKNLATENSFVIFV